MPNIHRCAWAKHELEIAYHDQQWGVPEHDDCTLFKMLTLEGAQAGLSWLTILKKQDGYMSLFKQFNIAKVAKMTGKDVERLMLDARIVRNRLKIESTISNAKAIQNLQANHGSFNDWLWRFVDGKPVVNRYKSLSDLPAETPISKSISKELKKLGCRFVGPTIIYAFMQATGMVNDHVVSCFRHKELL